VPIGDAGGGTETYIVDAGFFGWPSVFPRGAVLGLVASEPLDSGSVSEHEVEEEVLGERRCRGWLWRLV
jgi:hypothetical protein